MRLAAPALAVGRPGRRARLGVGTSAPHLGSQGRAGPGAQSGRWNNRLPSRRRAYFSLRSHSLTKMEDNEEPVGTNHAATQEQKWKT